MITAVKDGLVASVFVVGMQVVYRSYAAYFAPVAVGALALLLFYRKLDRIEVALSEERRRRDFQRRWALGRWVMVFIGVAAVLTVIGSYAVWKWVPLLD